MACLFGKRVIGFRLGSSATFLSLWNQSSVSVFVSLLDGEIGVFGAGACVRFPPRSVEGAGRRESLG